MVIYDGLKINAKQETSALTLSKQTINDTTSTPNSIKKNRPEDNKPITKIELDDPSSTKKNKRRGGGANGQLLVTDNTL